MYNFHHICETFVAVAMGPRVLVLDRIDELSGTLGHSIHQVGVGVGTLGQSMHQVGCRSW